MNQRIRVDAAEPAKEILTVEGVAHLLDVKPQTVRKWIKADKLRAYKLGNSYRVKRDDVIAFLEEGEL